MLEETVKLKVQEAITDSQQNLLQELNSMMEKISQQNSVSNDEQFQKLSNLVATGEMPKFKKKGNEEQFKVNSKILLRLDEAEQSIESLNADKCREKIVEGRCLKCGCISTLSVWFGLLKKMHFMYFIMTMIIRICVFAGGEDSDWSQSPCLLRFLVLCP